MPIRFRCGYCNRLLGIARRKAGTNTTCPHCGATIAVPTAEEAGLPAHELAEIDQLLKSDRAGAGGSGPSPAVIAAVPTTEGGFSTTPSAPQSPTPAPSGGLAPHPQPLRKPRGAPTEPVPIPQQERPLFERGAEAVLGDAAPASPLAAESPKGASSPEALSLDEEVRDFVFTRPQVYALAAAAAVVVVLAFVAGYFIGAR